MVSGPVALWISENTLYVENAVQSVFHLTAAIADIFEVRGALTPFVRRLEFIDTAALLGWRYYGRDGIWRGALIPKRRQTVVTHDAALGDVTVSSPNGFALHCLSAAAADPDCWPAIAAALPDAAQSWARLQAEAQNFSAQFDTSGLDAFPRLDWVGRSIADLYMLTGTAPGGEPCVQAGIPWFCAVFGRDSLITAEQALNAAPFIARQTLRTLGSLQATAHDPRSDAQPGKIIHEARFSERSQLRDVPFGRYYGAIDSTPLYLSLMAAYSRRTGDAALAQEQQAHIVAAAQWLTAQLTPQDFLIYSANQAVEGPHGLIEKCWKDGAPVIHADGRRAAHPIAMCEVQGYAYRALLDVAWLADMLLPAAKIDTAALRRRAARLKSDFEAAFWMEDLGTYALALDGAGMPCRVVSSNPGHLLRTGIIENPARIARVAATFADPAQLFSGWGARTLSAGDKSYDPDSYQLGGVWPHDTAEAIRGLLHVGQQETARRLRDGLFDLAVKFDGRLPELISGHERRGDAVVGYSNSCRPQGWSASIPFCLLASGR